MTTVGLIVPAETYRASAFLQAAAKLGLEVVIISDTEQALSSIMGDHFLQVPLGEIEMAANEIARLNDKVHLDGVVAIDDTGLFVAARASEALGLRHNSLEALRLTRDKAAMRKRCAEHGVSQPRFAVVSDDETHIGDGVAEAGARLGYPVVVKPTGLAASRGVIRADDRDSAKRAGEWSLAITSDAGQKDASLVVEEFIGGDEVALEGRLRDGVLETLAIFDKPDPMNGPYFEETLYVTPTELTEVATTVVAEEIQRACSAIGLVHGPVHGEARLSYEANNAAPRVVFIEVGARTIGGRCGKALRFENDITIEEIVLTDALGLAFEHVVQDAVASGVLMLPIERSGVLIEVAHQEKARQLAHIDEVEITVAPGRELRRFPESDRYLGFVFAHAQRRDDVLTALHRAKETLEVRVSESAMTR